MYSLLCSASYKFWGTAFDPPFCHKKNPHVGTWLGAPVHQPLLL